MEEAKKLQNGNLARVFKSEKFAPVVRKMKDFLNENLLKKLEEKVIAEKIVFAMLEGKNLQLLGQLDRVYKDTAQSLNFIGPDFREHIVGQGNRLLLASYKEEIKSFLDFILEVDQIVLEVFQNNKILRAQRNKALETLVGCEWIENKKIDQSYLPNSLLELLHKIVLKQESEEQYLKILIEMLSLLDPSLYCGGIQRSFLKFVLNKKVKSFELESFVLNEFSKRIGDKYFKQLLEIIKQTQNEGKSDFLEKLYKNSEGLERIDFSVRELALKDVFKKEFSGFSGIFGY